ncbi:alpha/beta hydrolase [Sorangium sp. So ce131]
MVLCLRLPPGSCSFWRPSTAAHRISGGPLPAPNRRSPADDAARLDCIREFSEVDYSEDLKKIDVPTLIVHGDDDQIVPIQASAVKAAKLAPKATLKVFAGADHGLAQTRAGEFNAEVLAFIKG